MKKAVALKKREKPAKRKGLENVTLLSKVFLNNNQLTDISILEKSAQTLTKVYVNNNQISDLSALENCVGLQYLSVDNNQINTLENITNCTTITQISAAQNQLVSLDGLENCSALEYIDASDNQLKSTQALESLKLDADCGLRVDLSNNQITNPVLGIGNYYWYLDLSGNPVQSLDILSDNTGFRVAFDYAETLKLENLAGYYNNLWIMNCPLDKQMAVKEIFEGYSVTFDNLSEMESAKQVAIPDTIKGDTEYYNIEN